MKKVIISIIAAVIAAVCLVTGCGGTYIPPQGDGSGDGTNRPVAPPSDEQSTGDYTVRLVNQDGTVYTQEKEISVTWSDGITQPVTAKIGEDNIARANALDGDYRISLSGLEAEYAYDPNGNIATSYARKIDVTVYKITKVSASSGKTLETAFELSKEGAYSFSVGNAFAEKYFMFEPKIQGTYEVRSFANIDENLINPKLRECFGTRFGKRTKGSFIKGGGATNTFTVNFVYEHGFNYDELGNIMLFGITAETRTQEYPVTVTFLVKRTGDYRRDDIMSTMVMPNQFASVQSGEETEQAFKSRMMRFMRGGNGLSNYYVNIFDATNGYMNSDYVVYDEHSKYYYVYDPVTQTRGAVLCAKITKPSAVFDDPEDTTSPKVSFSDVEYQGNKALTINDNYDWNYKKTKPEYNHRDPVYLNYKVFIEGYNGIAAHEDPVNFPGLKEQFKQYEGVFGYADFADDIEGVYPVTKELQRFLQGYAVSARLFLDGNGFAEAKGFRAAEEDQWLFACGYFV